MFLKIGGIFAGLAALLCIANSMREGGLGILDMFGLLGKYGKGMYVLVTKKPKQAFNLLTAIGVAVSGLVLWITLEVMSPEDEGPKSPLDMAPPTAQNGGKNPEKLTIQDIVPQ
ncbi:MAG: hypothetical protein AB7L92_02330 [Alphaproteobacteria bacterium]